MVCINSFARELQLCTNLSIHTGKDTLLILPGVLLLLLLSLFLLLLNSVSS